MASYRDRVLLQVSCAIAALGLLLTTGDDEIPRPRRWVVWYLRELQF